MRKCFERRLDYWKEVPNFTSVFHFKWQPVSRGIHFEQLCHSQKQMVNHFEFHAEITTKDNLFKNFLAFAELNNFNAFDYIPLTFALDLDAPTYSADFEKFAYCYATIDATIASLGKTADQFSISKLINQKLHRISFSKDRRTVSHSRAKLPLTHLAGHNLWILKPTGFNRGVGVSVFDSIEKLKALIRLYSQSPATTDPNKDPELRQAAAEVPRTRTFVIQKYVERPLLIRGRKFDIRVWVLVTHELRVHFFREGYLRTSSELFTMDSSAVGKKNVHLTNNAVQKYCNNYGQFEDGNQLSFPQFQVLPIRDDILEIPGRNHRPSRGRAEGPGRADEESLCHVNAIREKEAQRGRQELLHGDTWVRFPR